GMCGTGLIGVTATRGLDLTGVTPTAGAAYIADDLAQPFHGQACEKASALSVSRPLDFEHADRRQPIDLSTWTGCAGLDWLRRLGLAAPAWTGCAGLGLAAPAWTGCAGSDWLSAGAICPGKKPTPPAEL